MKVIGKQKYNCYYCNKVIEDYPIEDEIDYNEKLYFHFNCYFKWLNVLRCEL